MAFKYWVKKLDCLVTKCISDVTKLLDFSYFYLPDPRIYIVAIFFPCKAPQASAQMGNIQSFFQSFAMR